MAKKVLRVSGVSFLLFSILHCGIGNAQNDTILPIKYGTYSINCAGTGTNPWGATWSWVTGGTYNVIPGMTMSFIHDQLCSAIESSDSPWGPCIEQLCDLQVQDSTHWSLEMRCSEQCTPGYPYSYQCELSPPTTYDQIFTASCTYACIDCPVTCDASAGITPQKQGPLEGGPVWAGEEYNNTDFAIWEKGCALTSLSMAINAALWTLLPHDEALKENVDPGILNTLFDVSGTYEEYLDKHGVRRARVDWINGIKAWKDCETCNPNELPLKFDNLGGVKTGRFDENGKPLLSSKAAFDALDSQLCGTIPTPGGTIPRPVIVGVNLDAEGRPGHFVLVTGKDSDGDYIIFDPGHPKTHLSEYKISGFQTRGVVRDPVNLSFLSFASGHNADLLVIDPFDNETGFDPSTASILQNIPESAYFEDRIDTINEDCSTTPDPTLFHSVEIREPQQGTYLLVVHGNDSGPYTVSIDGSSEGGVGKLPVALQGNLQIGSLITYQVDFSPNDPSNTTVTLDTTRTVPGPNPMTWATPPVQTGTDSISMVATTASDPVAPIHYYFDFVGSPTGGTGGLSSGWQPGSSYTNLGLQPNHQYGYRVRARNGANHETSYSTPAEYAYTAIESPIGISFGTVTSTSIPVQSTDTPSGLNRGNSGLLIENTTNSTNSTWKQDNNFWTSNPLTPNTSYTFRVKGRNGDAVETGYSPIAAKYTLANVPGSPSFSNVTQTSIRANWTANGNPSGTQYLCENQTLGTNSGWITATSWDSGGLTCGTSYSFRLKAKNDDGIETVYPFLGSQLTLACSGDTTPPSLSVTSHTNGQHVSASNITLGGTASDSGRGDNGIQQVTVNGVRANNDTTTGNGTANWSKGLTLNPGANSITVIAYDDSTNHNTTTQNITIYYDVSTIYVSKDGSCNGNNPCFKNIQNGIASASAPTAIKITQETYNEDVVLDFNETICLEGGWDTAFTTNFGQSTINGSLTISNGKMIINKIILQ